MALALGLKSIPCGRDGCRSGWHQKWLVLFHQLTGNHLDFCRVRLEVGFGKTDHTLKCEAGLEVTKFRKCRVIMFKIDMSWQSSLTLKLRLEAVPSYEHEGVRLQPGDPAN